MGSNPYSNLKFFMLVLTFNLLLIQLPSLPVEIPLDALTKIDKGHLRSRAPCLQNTDRSLQVPLGSVPTVLGPLTFFVSALIPNH